MIRFAWLLVGYAMTILVTLSSTPVLADETSGDQVWTVVQASLCPPYQIPDEKCSVYGLSLGVVMVGVHSFITDEDYLGKGDDTVAGLQLCGLLSFAKKIYGLQVSGLANNTGKMPCGIQMACVLNYVERDMGFGSQVAGVWNRCDSGAGLQLGIANEADQDFAGVQLGLFNWGESEPTKERMGILGLQTVIYFVYHVCHQQGVDDMRGLQFGLLNKASDLHGIQCGLLWNDAKVARGIQLGLVNTADSMAGIQIGLANIIRESPAPFLPLINAHF